MTRATEGIGAVGQRNQVRKTGVHNANAAPRPVCARGSGTGWQRADDPDRLN